MKKRHRLVFAAALLLAAHAAADGTNRLWFDNHLTWAANEAELMDIALHDRLYGVVVQCDWSVCEASDDTFDFSTVIDDMDLWKAEVPGIKFIIRTAPWTDASGGGMPTWLTTTALGTSGKLFKTPGSTTGDYIPRAWVSGGTFQLEYAEFLLDVAAEFDRTTGSPPGYYANILYLWAGT